jgi:hypothetical protein
VLYGTDSTACAAGAVTPNAARTAKSPQNALLTSNA